MGDTSEDYDVVAYANETYLKSRFEEDYESSSVGTHHD